VTIGHGALLTSCTVGDRSLIGQGAVVQEGCEIGSNSIVAAGAVVLPGARRWMLLFV
jgi:carbonic anhydrase/acetyltransferase-like protein (isoleucine patch superfamily)